MNLNNNSSKYPTEILNRPLSDFMSAILREEELTTASFIPPGGSAWSGDALNLRFVMPGVCEKDFSLTARGETLVLTGFRVPPPAQRRTSG